MSFQPVNMLKYPAGMSVAALPLSMNVAKIGASSRAASISRPWKKSVQQTAEKPPRKVYTIMTAAAMYIAMLASRPMTVLNSVPQALMLLAA